MRVTTALTAVMFALLIGMLSTPPAEAGVIKKGTISRGDSVTLCALNVLKDGTPKDATTPGGGFFEVPNGKTLVCHNICAGEEGKNITINGCSQGDKRLKKGDETGCLNSQFGQTYGPGVVTFVNNSSKDLDIRIDCVVTR